MTEPSISVVIPTRDRAGLLGRALASVARQDQDLDVVVVDDGDGTGALAARQGFGRPLTTLLSARAGQVAARNLGVAAARGRFIAFLDDDDWWDEPFHLSSMMALAAPYTLVFASGRIVVEGERTDAGTSLPFRAKADPVGIRQDNELLVSGVVYPRTLHNSLGAFDPDLPYYWDWDWYLRLFAAGIRFTAAPSDAVRISARGDSVSADTNKAEREANLMRLARKHGLAGLTLKNHESIARGAEQARSERGLISHAG